MYIKIKIESKDQEEKSEIAYKFAPYFQIDNDTTISDAKNIIETYIDVPADSQEIRTLTKTFNNSDKVCDIWDLEQKEGASLMLFSVPNNRSDKLLCEDPEMQFFCFLQLFKSQEKLKENELKPQQKSPKLDAFSSTSVLPLIVMSSDSDTESDSSKSSFSSDGSSNENSDSVTSSADDSRKRKSSPLRSIKEKMPRHMQNCVNISSTLRKYLEEFPNYSQPIKTVPYASDFKNESSIRNECIEHKAKANQIPQKCNEDIGNSCDETVVSSQICANSSSSSEVTSESSLNSVVANVTQSNVKQNQVTTTTLTHGGEKKDTLHAVLPEKRDFIVVASTNSNSNGCLPYEIFFQSYFEKFRESGFSPRLCFRENSAFEIFNGVLWIICEDKETCEWLLNHSEKLSNSYRVERLRDFLKLKPYQVVIPRVCKSNQLRDIFELLENQNPKLNTNLWIVQKVHEISNELDDFYHKTVCAFCVNDVFSLHIDEETNNFLGNCGHKLKYCFWKIVFHNTALE